MPTELHLALQRYYAGDSGQIEARYGRYKVDVLRDGVAYEVQTRSFARLRSKVEALSNLLPVVIVYPVADTKVIVRTDPATGAELSARKSPKRGDAVEVFPELRAIAPLLSRGTVSLEIVHTIERELRCDDGKGSRYRRRVSLAGRELVAIVQTRRFAAPSDYAALLPTNLPEQFTVADLAQAAGIGRWLSGQMASTLVRIGTTQRVGKRGNAYIYQLTHSPGATPPAQEPQWSPVRCSRCGLIACEVLPGSVVRWRCSACQSLEVGPEAALG